MKVSLRLMICHNFGSRVDLIQNCGGYTISFPWGRGDLLLPGFGGRKGDLAWPTLGLGLISLRPQRRLFSTRRRSWSSSDMWRGSFGRGNPLLHTFVGCKPWRCCAPHLWAPPHRMLLSCRLQSRCPVATQHVPLCGWWSRAVGAGGVFRHLRYVCLRQGVSQCGWTPSRLGACAGGPCLGAAVPEYEWVVPMSLWQAGCVRSTLFFCILLPYSRV